MYAAFMILTRIILFKTICDHVEDFKPIGELLGD